jgi:transcriptional regulator with XRE-family HTH domain
MIDPDPKTTLRELREYFASGHESQRKIAARIGVSQTTIWAWLAGTQHPAAESVARLRAFFDAEAKRLAQGDGIRPIERVPFKIVKPAQRVRHPRLCPFCRKAQGQDSQARRHFVSGGLPEVWSKRPGPGEPPGSAQGVEREGVTLQKRIPLTRLASGGLLVPIRLRLVR